MKKLLVLIMLFALALPAQAATPKATIVCKLTADHRLIEKGEMVTITWSSINGLIAYGPGGKRIAPHGSMQVKPTETTIYKFKFVGLGGNEKCGVRIRVKGDEVER